MQDDQWLELPREVLLNILNQVKSTATGNRDAEAFAGTCRTFRDVYYFDWQKFHIQRMRETLLSADYQDKGRQQLQTLFEFCSFIALHPKLPAKNKVAVISNFLDLLKEKQEIDVSQQDRVVKILEPLAPILHDLKVEDLSRFFAALNKVIRAKSRYLGSSEQTSYEQAKSIFEFFIRTLEFVPSNQQGQTIIKGIRKLPTSVYLEKMRESSIIAAMFFIPILTLFLPPNVKAQLPCSPSTLLKILVAATLLRYIVRTVNRMLPEDALKNYIGSFFPTTQRVQPEQIEQNQNTAGQKIKKP
ncbi:MAG TPA: hypothetical protein VGV92_08650 [Gammaproteobacteria bacterium]|nr:hypothetical protein [Gammaproteobacteria bacterium]